MRFLINIKVIWYSRVYIIFEHNVNLYLFSLDFSLTVVEYYVLIPIVSNEAPEEAAWMTDGEDNILLDEPYIQYHYFCYAMGDQEVCRNAPQYDGRFV